MNLSLLKSLLILFLIHKRYKKHSCKYNFTHYDRSMMSLQDTLTLNNRAVELFHRHDIREAVKNYHYSLCALRDLTGIAEDATITQAPPQRECFHRSLQPLESLPAGGNKLYLYQNTLILQDTASSSQNPPRAVRTCGGAVLFNTAILYHQIFIETGNSVSMNKAQELYQSSLQFLGGLSLNSNDTVALLIIANQNNLAMIELEKGFVMEAAERLRYLSHLFHTIRPTIRRIFAMDEARGLFSNTLIHDGIISSPAA